MQYAHPVCFVPATLKMSNKGSYLQFSPHWRLWFIALPAQSSKLGDSWTTASTHKFSNLPFGAGAAISGGFSMQRYNWYARFWTPIIIEKRRNRNLLLTNENT